MTKTSEKKAPAQKKSPKAEANGKPAKAAKAAPKSRAEHADRDGILRPQARILAALAKASPQPLNKAAIAERADVHPNWVAEYVGSDDMVSDRVRGCLKLMPAKLVKLVKLPVDDEKGRLERNYEITAAGRKALERHEKAQKKAE